MSGIWVDYKGRSGECISQAYAFWVSEKGDARELKINWSEDDCGEVTSTLRGEDYDIDTLMSNIKQAIKNGDRLIEVDLEKYELS